MANTQRGQALAESLVVLGALGSLWLGIAWLGRTQDAALQLSHASRQAAFAWAHQGVADVDLAAQALADIHAPGQRGRTRQGDDLLPQGIGLRVDASPRAHAGRWPGDPVAEAAQARRELQLGDDIVWRLQLDARTAAQAQTSGRLRDFDRLALFLRRHTAILRGNGAASDDAAVQAVLGGSEQLWGAYARASQTAGQAVDQRVQGVDAAWGRAHPQWDWLDAWTAQVPERHLRAGGTP